MNFQMTSLFHRSTGRNILQNYQKLQQLHTSKWVSAAKVGEGEQAKFFPAAKTNMLAAGTFKGKTVFITGGGTGLGKGMAKILSSLGANVAIAARRLAVLEETAQEITKETGNRVLPLKLDIRNPENVKEAFDECESEFGLPTIVINNAAGNFIAPFERLSPNGWKAIVDIVLNGTAYVTLEAGKRLIKAGKGGTFLAVTTGYAKNGSGFVCPSASAKAGVEIMTKSLASEWGRYGIRLNCISPGPILTEGAFARLDPTGEFQNTAYTRIPAGRLGQIEEFANLVSYLVSDYSNWMSGEVVGLDGGEYGYLAGAFNIYSPMTPDQWDAMEKQIRSHNDQSKAK